MEKQPSHNHQWYLAIIALLAWFALGYQLYININSGAAPTSELIIRFFSYFTILTNIMLATCCSVMAIKKNSFMEKQPFLTALTVYILIVGIIYNIFLRSLWHPQGLQLFVDELLHTIIPVLFLFYWILFVRKDQLSRKSVLAWLIYPALYTIFILFRGSYSGFYPYPFINVAELGFLKVMMNAIGISFAFILVALLFIGIGNSRNDAGYQAGNYQNS